MEEAERIAREEHGSGKIAVISGKGEGGGQSSWLVHIFNLVLQLKLPHASFAPAYVQNGTELNSEIPVFKLKENSYKQFAGIERSEATYLWVARPIVCVLSCCYTSHRVHLLCFVPSYFGKTKFDDMDPRKI